MAAAEYYNASIAHTAPQYSPYHQSPHQQPHELYGSPVPNYALPQGSQTSQSGPAPPPYQQQDHKPSVHLTPNPVPSHLHRPSSSSNSHRPSFSSQAPASQGHYLKPPPLHNSHHSQHSLGNGPSQAAVQAPHMRPYMNGNQSEYSVNSGYSSDPEQKRRRRHRRHEHKNEQEASRDMQPKKDRSRSTNTEGFLGAAGGGLIGDLIFPGLGTVGGAVAGWLGGKDYGKHRQHKEDKLQREQREWEYRFRDRSNSNDSRHSHEHHHDHRIYPKHKTDY